MIQAALRRANELEQLRSLPTDPVRLPAIAAPLDDRTTGAAPPEVDQAVAGLQSGGQPAAPEEVTGSIDDNSGATIPIDIGEASSTELPVGPVEEKLPVSGVQDSRVPDVDVATPPTTPAAEMRQTVLPLAKPKVRAVQRRPRHRSAPPAPHTVTSQVPPPFNFFAAFFASLSHTQPAAPANSPMAKTAQSSSYRQASGKRAVTQ